MVWKGAYRKRPVIRDITEHYSPTVRFLAAVDPQPLLALFKAIEANSIQAIDYLRNQFHFDLFSVRHPVTGQPVEEFVLVNCDPGATVDYMVTAGLFDKFYNEDGHSLLRLSCEILEGAKTPNIVHVVRLLRHTDCDPFETVDGKSLLHVLADGGHDLEMVCAFVWCMCDRYASPRWREMVSDFLLKVAKGTIQLRFALALRTRSPLHLAALRPTDAQTAEHQKYDLTWYPRLFFLLQRAGVVEPKVESSAFLQQCIAAARETDHQTFIAAASTDFTVESFVHLGVSTIVTFQTAHLLTQSLPSSTAKHSKG